MNKIYFCLSILAILLVTPIVSAQDVKYNFDKDTDFSRFKTYKWVALKDAPKVDNLLDKQIRESIDEQLATKGLQRVEDDSANLYIGYQAGVGQEKQFTSYSSGWGHGPGWYGGGWYTPGGSTTTSGQTSTIYTGQLALDMYDSANHDLVWRGLATKTIDVDAKPEKQEKNLAKTVDKLLKNYPPPKKD
jgi:hypothetical protein